MPSAISKAFIAKYKSLTLPELLEGVLRNKKKVEFTLQQGTSYDYFRFIDDPDEAFEASTKYASDITMLMAKGDIDVAYYSFMEDAIGQMIYASNFLEEAGSTREITVQLCKIVLAGDTYRDDHSESDQIFQAIEDDIIDKKGKNEAIPDTVIHACKQIIQHAFALKYLIYRFVVRNEDLTEELIKSTHQILTDGIYAENAEKDGSSTYGGIFRKESVCWAFLVFCPPESIPGRMKITLESFKAEADQAKDDTVDPFSLATKYFHKLLDIHPFLDGNSRLCRLILNVILLKYLGIIVPIGRDELEAAKFKETVTRALEIQHGEEENEDEDEGDSNSSKDPWAEVKTFVAIQGRSTLQMLRDCLLASKDGGKTYERRESVVENHPEIPTGDEEVENVSHLIHDCTF